MANKRRDKKGRILRNGETQRSDGRYTFRWQDEKGKTQSIYAWRLVETDVTPVGKREGPSLRAQEARLEEVERQKEKTLTVLELVERYIAGNGGVKNTTKNGYRTVVNFLKKDPLGNKKIDEVTLFDAREWLVGLQASGMSYSSIHTKRGVLRPAFALAVEAGLINKNPFNFELGKCLINDSARRDAYTPEQQRKFLEFVKSDSRFRYWYNGYVLMFGTGIRIGELCALTISDVDFTNKAITINKELLRANGQVYIQHGAKTKAGVRIIPITKDVEGALMDEISKPRPDIEPEVDGVSGFVFLNTYRKAPSFETGWAHNCKRAIEKYNSIYKKELPPLSPHD